MEIFVSKENEQHGPFDAEQLLALLNEGELNRRDLVYYEGLGEWKPLDEVFEVEEALLHFMDEGQDSDVVAEVFQQVTQLISSHEKIFYIAHQKRKIMKTKPDCVVVTNERLIVIRQSLGGSRLEDHQWKDIIQVTMKDGLLGTTFEVLDRTDHILQIDDLPKAQLEKVCQLAQEMRA
jgi:Bacterial PH domain/GYF domain 2